MSTKGKTLSQTAKTNISLAKSSHTAKSLSEVAMQYLNTLENDPKRLPTLSGYALAAGIGSRALQNYRMKFEEVDHICEYIETLQEEHALTTISPLSQFLLKSKHGYRDQPQQLTQNNYSNISPEVLVEALKLMQKTPNE
jgi:UDP-N-acetylenolpyruvoylglucosamine reductase